MSYNIISKEELKRSETIYLFQGEEHGDVPISFFWLSTLPGRGPSLHVHPYQEVFILQQGQATFTVCDALLEVHGGEIVIVPTNTPHKFKNSGEEPLQMISIHVSKRVIQKMLED